jgi:beta-galactosidase
MATQNELTRRSLLTQAAGAAGLASVLGAAGPARAQAAAGQDGRVRESFDFGWKFFKGDAPGAQQADFADATWRNLDLPHDWSIEGPFDEKEPAGGQGAYLPTGIGWYRKRFRLPESYRDKKVAIEFDGVYENSEVWINGQYLGRRPYGYMPFRYDLTPYLNLGARDNVIAVKADNSRQINCRWYSGSGISRHTWLLATNSLHVAYWGTFVTFPKVSNDAATLQVKTRVHNDGKAAALCTLATAILDRDGNAAGTAESRQEIAPGTEYEFVDQVGIASPKLWSIANPYLYKVRSTVSDQGRVVDQYDTPIGIREIVFDADKGCLVNGEHVKLNGVCLHHECGCVGAAVPERVWERRLEILKEMGCNAIRTSHNPYAAEFLDLCDRMGFLVMADLFDEWKVPKDRISYGYHLYFDEWYERDAKNFVHRDRNHPAVALWCAGNEIGDQYDPNGAETLRKLLEVFHAEDPTRPVTAACNFIMAVPLSRRARPEFLALLDIVGYNYVDQYGDRIEKYYSIDKAAFPQRRVIGTENHSMGAVVRGDYRSLFPQAAFRGFPGRFRHIDVEQLWKFVRTYDYVIGDFMWTGIDHLGEVQWPEKGSSTGVIDICGFPKDGYYFYQSQWTGKPMLHLFPHWNWKGKEGQFIPVTCYTNCDVVELFVNGRSVGQKASEFPRLGVEEKYRGYPPRARVTRTTADLHLSWDVPYEPGTLKAVGTIEGKVVATAEIATTGAPAAVVLSVDREAISADCRDVAHFKVEIVDDKGAVVPTADNEVTFQVEGVGRLIGVDNGDPASHDDYRSSRHKAFNGLALAIVQSTAKAGQIRVTATCPGLKPGTAAAVTRA